ncbi:MAG: glycosyltransferase family 39 protein [Elusimicrobiota bacterium]|nr:glycosyltransferase family 39 protein [Elusimicrobiota bacterium]
MNLSGRLALIAAVLLAAGHLVLGGSAVYSLSATFDEPMHVVAGYTYWLRGDMRLDPNNPPLAKMLLAAPLLPRAVAVPWETREWLGGLHYAFGERVLYWNGNDADALLTSARLVNLFLSAVLLLILWRWSASRWGEAAGLAAAAVYAASPAVLAHASLATNDLTACFFALLGVLACVEFAERGRREAALAAGLAAAACVLSKYSGVILCLVYAGILFSDARARRKDKALEFAIWAGLPWLAIMGAFLAINDVALAGFIVRVRQVTAGTHPVFVLGDVYPSGWIGTYAVALLSKSTPIELATLAAGAYMWRKQRSAAQRAPWIILVLYFAAATMSRKQIGLRYILPVYPAIALLAGVLVSQFAAGPRKRLAAALAAGQLLSALLIAPDFLAYFNSISGGSARGYLLLGDANLDWGQDLKRLGAYLRAEGSPEVTLSYFGTASPEYYGIAAQLAGSSCAINRLRVNSAKPARELFVISATNLQGTYTQDRDLRWTAQRPLLARVGLSLFVYDVTNDEDFHRRLAAYYAAGGDAVLASRENARARMLAATP